MHMRVSTDVYLHVRVVGGLHSDVTDGGEDVVRVQDTAEVHRRDGDGEGEDPSLFLVPMDQLRFCLTDVSTTLQAGLICCALSGFFRPTNNSG